MSSFYAPKLQVLEMLDLSALYIRYIISNPTTVFIRCYHELSRRVPVFPESLFTSISRFFYRVTLPCCSHLSEKVSVIGDEQSSTIRKLIALSEVIKLTKNVQFTPQESASIIHATQKIDQAALAALSKLPSASSLQIEIEGSEHIPRSLSLFENKLLLHFCKPTEDQATIIIDTIHRYLFDTHLDYQLMLVSEEQLAIDPLKTREAIQKLFDEPPEGMDGRRAKLRIQRFFIGFCQKHTHNSRTYQSFKPFIDRVC